MKNNKTILIALGIFLIIVIGVFVFAQTQKKTVKAPITRPVSSIVPSIVPEIPPINAVGVACSTTFVVACTSPSPSPSVSPGVSPSLSPSPSPSPSSLAMADLDCLSKRVYEDDSRNRAGFYYLETEIIDTSTLQNGQIIVYNISIKNHGDAVAPETNITDVLSSNLTYIDSDNGCAYDTANRKVTCTVGSLGAGVETSRSIRASIAVAGSASILNTAEVYSTNGQRNACSITVDATGKVIVPPSPVPTALPVAGVFEVTTQTLGVGMMLLIFGALGLLLL